MKIGSSNERRKILPPAQLEIKFQRILDHLVINTSQIKMVIPREFFFKIGGLSSNSPRLKDFRNFNLFYSEQIFTLRCNTIYLEFFGS